MDCPYCDCSAPRMSLHRHLVEEHTERVERDDEGYVYTCPICGDETSIEPGTVDEEALDGYAKEIRTLAFDALLDHIEEEHEGED